MKERSAVLLSYSYERHGKDGIKIVFQVLYKDNEERGEVEAFHPDMFGKSARFVAKTIAMSLVNSIQTIRQDEKGRPYIRLYNNRGGLSYASPNIQMDEGCLI